VIGCTLTPFGGASPGYHTPDKEARRQAVNRWIRTGGAFDGVADLDAALRDPARPGHLLPDYDSGDHLHPGDAGYRAMAEAIGLGLLGAGGGTPG
jgi:lysophospholipase L1-like esterase